MFEFACFLIIIGFAYFAIRDIRESRQSRYKETDKGFSSNGVTVDYQTGDVSIRGYPCRASEITGISWRSNNNYDGWVTRYNSTVVIMVASMVMPKHEIELIGKDTAEIFTERFRLAISKARNRRDCPVFAYIRSTAPGQYP